MFPANDLMGFTLRLRAIAERCLAICKKRKWKTDWSARGAYLFLESAEFIEALRGKGDSTPEEEAADVFMVLLSTMASYKVSFPRTMGWLFKKMDAIENFEIGDGKKGKRRGSSGRHSRKKAR